MGKGMLYMLILKTSPIPIGTWMRAATHGSPSWKHLTK